ncbi:MAG: gamma-glutamylcyclotransferase [Myxococcales bacterium]|nr:gamma-glutamylcyclotransferase [Myxococcales bacterium]
MAATGAERRFRIFIYGTELPGEPDHALLAGAVLLGPARTAPGYALVELVGFAGLVAEGQGEVTGELWEMPYETLRGLDVRREVGRLFQRRHVRLADGSDAEAYVLETDQVRGKRRVRGGDWRARFAPQRPGELHEAGPFVRWARSSRPR